MDMTHPYILNAERTGYPNGEPNAVHTCECCGRGIYDGQTYFDELGPIICEDCLDAMTIYEFMEINHLYMSEARRDY